MKQIINKIFSQTLKITIGLICLIGLFGFLSKSTDEPTMTYVDQITITSIPKYRDIEQAMRDEDLPTGALFIISGEDYLRIKKYQL